MTTIGFLYPGHAAEDDYPRVQKMLGDEVRLVVRHTHGEDLHAVEELLDLGSERRLAEGARELAAEHPDAVLWACTSGSFVYGRDGARRQAEKLAEVAGVPASSTSFAFANALVAMRIRRVAVAASYPAEVAGLFRDFLADAGVEVLGLSSAGITTAAAVGELDSDAVVDLAVSHDVPEAQAVLVPDTAMRTVDVIGEIERRLGKPVLTANQVTVWEGLRLIGALRPHHGLGSLFDALLTDGERRRRSE